MSAARANKQDVTPLYLNSGLSGDAATELAQQLYVVLNSRLPARLNALSDQPEGTLANPLRPDRDVIGTISTDSGPLEIAVERVTRAGAGSIWLFSTQTLDSIPAVFYEVEPSGVDRLLPAFLTRPRIAGVRLSGWLMMLFAVPLLYRLMGWANPRLVLALVRRQRGTAAWRDAGRVPGVIRLFLLALAIKLLTSSLNLPLLERQFWSTIATLLAIVACAWAGLAATEYGERYVRQHVHGSRLGEIAALLRLGRRLADLLVIAAAVLVALRYFRVDPTAALAGLGIGGIAVALAAQKTLENVIGGLSLIFDQAVRVGDSLKLGDTVGTVDHIGLRSTRIRTMDRTIVSVPNGQVATVSLETLSARDKFWFHHFVGLRYETSAGQIAVVVDGIRDLLLAHRFIETASVRVQFFRLGQSSLDLEVSAYVFAADWSRFLEIQQELLLGAMEAVERAGTAIALPSQTLHVAALRERAG